MDNTNRPHRWSRWCRCSSKRGAPRSVMTWWVWLHNPKPPPRDGSTESIWLGRWHWLVVGLPRNWSGRGLPTEKTTGEVGWMVPRSLQVWLLTILSGKPCLPQNSQSLCNFPEDSRACTESTNRWILRKGVCRKTRNTVYEKRSPFGGYDEKLFPPDGPKKW